MKILIVQTIGMLSHANFKSFGHQSQAGVNAYPPISTSKIKSKGI